MANVLDATGNVRQTIELEDRNAKKQKAYVTRHSTMRVRGPISTKTKPAHEIACRYQR
jgi:hypothetical protein